MHRSKQDRPSIGLVALFLSLRQRPMNRSVEPACLRKRNNLPARMVRVGLNLLMVGKVKLPVTKRFGISPNHPPTFAVSWHCILTAGRKSVFSHVNQIYLDAHFRDQKEFRAVQRCG